MGPLRLRLAAHRELELTALGDLLVRDDGLLYAAAIDFEVLDVRVLLSAVRDDRQRLLRSWQVHGDLVEEGPASRRRSNLL